jgi:hypothetical protein
VGGGILLAFINPLAAIIPFLDPGSSADKEERANCKQTLSELKQSVKKDQPLVGKTQDSKTTTNADPKDKSKDKPMDASQKVRDTLQHP